MGILGPWPLAAAARCLTSGPPEEAAFDLGLLHAPAGQAGAAGRPALPAAPVWREGLAHSGRAHDELGHRGRRLPEVESSGAVRSELTEAGGHRERLRVSGRFRDLAANAIYRPRRIPLLNVHTGETATIEYYADGSYHADPLAQLDHFLRDWRTDATTRMDPRVIDILHFLWLASETGHPLHVLSAYRTVETNAMLARTNPLVARRSLHTVGKAIDFYLPSGDLGRLRDLAVAMRGGGVGYYPRSRFLHVDCGPVRCWTA